MIFEPEQRRRDFFNLALGFFVGQLMLILAFRLGVVVTTLLGGS